MSYRDRTIIAADRAIQAEAELLRRAIRRGLPRKRDRERAKIIAATVDLFDRARVAADIAKRRGQ